MMASTATTTAIRVDKLKVSLGGFTVLDLPRLDIAGPGLVVLEGHNGAGKSTLLRVLAGLLAPTSGSVVYLFDGGDQAAAQHSDAQQRCGYVPDHPVLFEDLSIADNLFYVAWTAGASEIGPEAISMIADLGFVDLLDRFPSQLSRGQRQLACLLAATVRPIECLLLDEPTLALDATNRVALADALVAQAKTGLVIVASHADVLLQRADRIIQLSDGELVEPDEDDESEESDDED